MGTGPVVREQPGVEHARGDDRHIALLAQGQQVFQGPLLEQGVPAGEHDDVQVGVTHELGEQGGLVHAGPVGGDQPVAAELFQRRECPLQRRTVMVIGVVHEGDVDTVQAQAGPAVVKRAQHAIPAVVADPPPGRRHVEALGVAAGCARRVWHQQPADLGGHHELVPGPSVQRGAEAAFRQAEPIVGCGVEVAYARRPGGVDGVDRVPARHRGDEVADLRCAERQLRDRQPAPPGRAGPHGLGPVPAHAAPAG